MGFTQQMLRDLFEYDQESGVFERKDKTAKRRAYTGTVNKRKHTDYAALCVNHKKIYAHRAAWIYVYGSIPDGMVIDHVDGNGLNNRIANLRVVTKAINQRNRKPSKRALPSGVYHHRGGFVVNFLGKYAAWKTDLFEACCIRKSLEAKNGYLNQGVTS